MSDETTQVNESTATQAQVSSATTNDTQVKSQPKPDRTFTRDEVTTILRKRLERANNSLYSKYGCKDVNEFNAYLDKAKMYDDVVKEKSELAERVAFMGNNIDPERYDDIRTYFKGKGLQFDETQLIEHMKTHPEWVKVSNVSESPISKPTTTIHKLGSDVSPQTKVTDQEKAEKMFGFKL